MAWYNPLSWLPSNSDMVMALDYSVVGDLYGLGADINTKTGGNSPNVNIQQAVYDHQPDTTYSATTQWLSGYNGATPNAGSWTIPVLNPDLAGNAAKDGLTNVWGIIEDPLKGGLKTVAVLAVGVALVLLNR